MELHNKLSSWTYLKRFTTTIVNSPFSSTAQVHWYQNVSIFLGATGLLPCLSPKQHGQSTVEKHGLLRTHLFHIAVKHLCEIYLCTLMHPLSLHFNGNFSKWTWVSRYQNVSILYFVDAKDDGSGGDKWICKTTFCTSQIITNNNGMDALPVAQPTVSEHLSIVPDLFCIALSARLENSRQHKTGETQETFSVSKLDLLFSASHDGRPCLPVWVDCLHKKAR